MFEEAGLPYAPPDVVPNTLPSLQLGELARDAGKLGDLHPRLFAAHWAEGRNIGDPEVLAGLAADAGLDADEALAAVRGSRYARRVLESTDSAMQAGAGGVPAWMIDGKLLVPGAQPHEVFDRVLQRLGHTPSGDG